MRVCRVSPIGLSALSAELGLGRQGVGAVAFSLQHASGQERGKQKKRLREDYHFSSTLTTTRHTLQIDTTLTVTRGKRLRRMRARHRTAHTRPPRHPRRKKAPFVYAATDNGW